MSFDPEIAAIRFGTGLSPKYAPPQSIDAIIAELAAPDYLAQTYPIETFDTLYPRMAELGFQLSVSRKNPGTEKEKAARKKVAGIRKTWRKDQVRWFNASLARYIDAPHGFRERLVRFWADHFTAVGQSQYYRHSGAAYVEEVIRPNMMGRFADLLKQASLHPMMLHYLDQNASVGPNSPYAKKKTKKNKGLNENLAREILELHSLGVGGAYVQADVREFAELLAGVLFTSKKGVRFYPLRAEPGTETVLGKTYSGPRASRMSVEDALEDLAAHPDTAQHIARKLVTHFVQDDPDHVLVDHVAAAYKASDGLLLSCYEALLSHPLAWDDPLQKMKQPFDFIATSLRALGVDTLQTAKTNERMTRLSFFGPLALMGQPWERASGPDGWPEEAYKWITPQGMAGRIQWAMMVPQVFSQAIPEGDILPVDLARTALGNRLSPQVKFAAGAAETKWEGVGLVLASPEFQRR